MSVWCNAAHIPVPRPVPPSTRGGCRDRMVHRDGAYIRIEVGSVRNIRSVSVLHLTVRTSYLHLTFYI